MTKIKKIKIVLVALILSLVAIPAFAAEVSFSTKTREIKTNQLFEVGVFINTDEESINAIEGKIIFSRDLLEIRKINDGNSIINFWIEKPKIISEGQIAFSGIVPGGYNDNQGLIFSITFLAKKEGNGAIEFSGVKTLRNDGKGTEASLTISNFKFLISNPPAGGPVPQITTPKTEDRNPPEEFTPQIAADPAIFDGKWFAVFATQDKASGIDHYEIKESRQKFFAVFKKWLSAESPQILQDQELLSYVFVKAVDKAGNSRIIKIAPRNSLVLYKNYKNWIIIIIGVVIVTLIAKKLWRRKHI